MSYNSKRLVTLSLASCLIAGCATPTLQTPTASQADIARESDVQRQYVIDRQIEQRIRLNRVAYSVATGAANFCKEQLTSMLGVTFVTLDYFSGEYRSVAQRAYNLSNRLSIVAVVPGSVAMNAGLSAGDEFVRLNGTPITNDNTNILTEALKASAQSQAPIEIEVMRNDTRQVVTVRPAPACDYPIEVRESNIPNAFADGERVIFTTAMLDFIGTDEELAVVLSHEYSHNILGHIDSQRQNTIVGGLAGLAVDLLVVATTGVSTDFTSTGAEVGRSAWSVEFEREADYQGLYLMRYAGYEVESAGNFWRRIAARNPDQIAVATTHPTSPERFLALQSAANEIRSKELQGLALLPNVNPGEEPVQFAGLSAPIGGGTTSALVAQDRPASSGIVTSSFTAQTVAPQTQAQTFGIVGTISRSALIGAMRYYIDGVRVNRVLAGGLAETAGIRRDDIILTVDGQPVTSQAEVDSYFANAATGSVIRLDIVRQQAEYVIDVPL